jgi:hypothetical protein
MVSQRVATMKIFLQHKESMLYFQKLDGWTPSTDEAFDFRHARKAIEFARLYCIDNVQIMVLATTKSGAVHKLPFEFPDTMTTPREEFASEAGARIDWGARSPKP